MTIEGLTPGGNAPRQLRIQDDPESPQEERWVIVSSIVAGTPHSVVRVPLAMLLEVTDLLRVAPTQRIAALLSSA
jgi:hypothetical protein